MLDMDLDNLVIEMFHFSLNHLKYLNYNMMMMTMHSILKKDGIK